MNASPAILMIPVRAATGSAMRERVLVPIEAEVSTRLERERRARPERRQIERGTEIDWRSYERRSVPNRWRV